LAFIFIVIALMNPLEPKKTVTTAKKEGADIFIILDISNSMLAEDIKPNRLEKSKQIIKTLLLKLGSDRVGIVLFAGDAFVYLPLTIDLSIANMMISEADPQLSQPQGTNINSALSTTFYAIERSKVKKPMVILFSDGENFEDDPNEILKDMGFETEIVEEKLSPESRKEILTKLYEGQISIDEAQELLRGS